MATYDYETLLLCSDYGDVRLSDSQFISTIAGDGTAFIQVDALRGGIYNEFHEAAYWPSFIAEVNGYGEAWVRFNSREYVLLSPSMILDLSYATLSA